MASYACGAMNPSNSGDLAHDTQEIHHQPIAELLLPLTVEPRHPSIAETQHHPLTNAEPHRLPIAEVLLDPLLISLSYPKPPFYEASSICIRGFLKASIVKSIGTTPEKETMIYPNCLGEDGESERRGTTLGHQGKNDIK